MGSSASTVDEGVSNEELRRHAEQLLEGMQQQLQREGELRQQAESQLAATQQKLESERQLAAVQGPRAVSCRITEMPDDGICPIGKMPMKRPVVARDGRSYEYEQIKAWFDTGKRTSPITNERISPELLENHALRGLLQVVEEMLDEKQEMLEEKQVLLAGSEELRRHNEELREERESLRELLHAALSHQEQQTVASASALSAIGEAQVPEALQARREEELSFYEEHRAAGHSHSHYIVNWSWLQAWQAFVKDDGPAPGPISNMNLLDEAGEPRVGLERGKDWYPLNEARWLFFLERYGGGPELWRCGEDLYGA